MPPSLYIQTDSNQGLIKWRQNKNLKRDGFVDFNNPDFVKCAESFGANHAANRVSTASFLCRFESRCWRA